MKVVLLVIVVLAAAALCVAGEKAKCAGTKCPYAGLSGEDRAAQATTNRHHVEHLDQWARKCVDAFLADLDQHDTVISLGHAIKGGHSILYEMVEGKDFGVVQRLATKHHIQLKKSRMGANKPCKCNNCCGRLLVPGKSPSKIVEAVEVPGKRQLRTNMPSSGERPYKKQPNEQHKLKQLKSVKKHEMLTQQANDKAATKCCLAPEKVQNYYDNNVHMATLMHVQASPLVMKFLQDLKAHAPKTVIHLMDPPKNGQMVRFTMVQGSIAAVQKYAPQCGLVLEGNTLHTRKVKPVSAEHTLEVSKKHHVVVGRREQTDGGVPAKVKVVTTGRKIVPKLADKWIDKTPPRFEQLIDGDDDAFLQQHAPAEAVSGDDDDAFLQFP